MFLGSLPRAHESMWHLSSPPRWGGVLQPYFGTVTFLHVTEG